MVRFELVTYDYKWCSESERCDRDKMAVDMAREICARYLNGCLDDSLYLMVSFFSNSVYCEFMEYLEVVDIKSICKVETGADGVIRITFETEESPLWTKRVARFE